MSDNHIGHCLKQNIIDRLGITPYALAKCLSVPPNRIYLILEGKRQITPDTAMRLQIYYPVITAYEWLCIQNKIELAICMAKHDYSHIKPIGTRNIKDVLPE
jgi:antitoxin HigA-1